MLDLRPQDRRARRLVELFSGETEDLGWLRPMDELWRMAIRGARWRSGGRPCSITSRCISCRRSSSRNGPAGLSHHLGRTGRDLRRRTLPYVAESQRLRVLRARILRRDGSEVSAQQGDTPRLAEPEFNLYYDTRLRVLDFPELEDGDLIEIAYVRTETIESNETGPYKAGSSSSAGRCRPSSPRSNSSGRQTVCRPGSSSTSRVSPSVEEDPEVSSGRSGPGGIWIRCCPMCRRRPLRHRPLSRLLEPSRLG